MLNFLLQRKSPPPKFTTRQRALEKENARHQEALMAGKST